MNAVDTNILIYAHDIRYPDKLTIAEDLIRTLTDGVLLWQVDANTSQRVGNWRR